MRYQIMFYAYGNTQVAFESLSSSPEAFALLKDVALGYIENGVRYTSHEDAEKLFVLIDALELNAMPVS